ncbi:MAG: hypothetical protein KF832_20770 [Caldilineaceae bacterium]|nr:hypothetical protein [Caldilineaceae bacterium]
MGWLVGATLGYLTLPVFLFELGWLRTPWAISFMLLTAIGLGQTLAEFGRTEALVVALDQWWQGVTRRGLLLTCLVCGGLVLISGVGGYGYQTGDWTKHEILLKDLSDYPWPVFYTYYDETVGLAYYLAYYLPAALVGKVGGILLANQALVLWTLAGLILAVCWFSVLTARSLSMGLTFFILFSGLSVVGFFLRFYVPVNWLAGAPDLNTAPWQTHPALWAAAWQYSPHVRGLFWVPQHVLPGWLITGLILFVCSMTSARGSLLFLWSLSALWSPFITIGLLPLFVADLLPRPDSRFGTRLRAYLSVANGCGLLLFLLMACFYATKLEPIAPVLNQGMRVGISLVELARQAGWPRTLFSYALFCLLEFGIFIVLDRDQALRTKPALRWAYWLNFLWLAVLPLLILGEHNDLSMRASIPALFFVAMVVGRNGFVVQPAATWRKILWVVVFWLGALSPFYEVGYQLARVYARGALYQFAVNPERDLAEKYVLDVPIMQQYASSIDTFFFRHLAKAPPVIAPAEAADAFLFNDQITLVDYLLDRTTAAPGDTLDLLLLWRAIQPISTNYVVAVRLVDKQGRVWWEHQAWPAGAPTSTWPVARRIWYDHHTPMLPVDTPTGFYRLELYLTDPATQAKLPTRQVTTGENSGEIVLLTYIMVGQPPTPAYPLAGAALFGEQIGLLGSNIAPQQQVAAGAVVPITLVWRAQQQPALDYTGFVQLLDAQGRLVAQDDHPLADAFIPASQWQPGLILADEYRIELPLTLPPGPYQLIVGIYDGQTGERLAFQWNGTAAGDTRMISEWSVGP